MEKEKISEGNRLIASYMGYIYYEPDVFYDFEEYSHINQYDVFSKVPIAIEKYEGESYLADLPNPDYGKEDGKKWNPSIETLSWATLNSGQYKINLKYHSDWNELMDVVEKIDEDYWMEINGTIVEIGCIGTSRGFIEWDSDSKIESVWMAVVEFVKWFNKKNPQA